MRKMEKTYHFEVEATYEELFVLSRAVANLGIREQERAEYAEYTASKGRPTHSEKEIAIMKKLEKASDRLMKAISPIFLRALEERQREGGTVW